LSIQRDDGLSCDDAAEDLPRVVERRAPATAHRVVVSRILSGETPLRVRGSNAFRAHVEIRAHPFLERAVCPCARNRITQGARRGVELLIGRRTRRLHDAVLYGARVALECAREWIDLRSVFPPRFARLVRTHFRSIAKRERERSELRRCFDDIESAFGNEIRSGR